MKKSEFKASIKGEIIEILSEESADEINAKAEAQAKLNKELETTASLQKESLNPEVSKTLDRFIKAMAKRYGYSEQDAVFAIMAALKQRDFDDDDDNEKKSKFKKAGEASGFDMRGLKEEDDDEPTASQLKSEPISKIGYKLADTNKEMKSVVKKWKDAEGAEKIKLTDRLRELTKMKKELESLL